MCQSLFELAWSMMATQQPKTLNHDEWFNSESLDYLSSTVKCKTPQKDKNKLISSLTCASTSITFALECVKPGLNCNISLLHRHLAWKTCPSLAPSVHTHRLADSRKEVRSPCKVHGAPVGLPLSEVHLMSGPTNLKMWVLIYSSSG